MDFRDSEVYSRLWHMTVCNMATDFTNPCSILYREVVDLAGLQIAVTDLWENGMGPPGLQFPPGQFFKPEEKPAFRLVLAMDLEFLELCEWWTEKVLWNDFQGGHSKPWNRICSTFRDWLGFVPANRNRFRYISHLILASYHGAVYIINIMKIVQSMLDAGIYQPISAVTRDELERLNALAMRPGVDEAPQWGNLMLLLQSPEVVYVGWGLQGDSEVLKDHLGLMTIEETGDRIFHTPHMLQHQTQFMKMQLKFGGTFYPNVIGYDVPTEPTNKVQTNLGLAASTVLSLAVQKRFLANLLSTTIADTPPGQQVPGTDARLLSFAQAARTRHWLIYFLRKMDFVLPW